MRSLHSVNGIIQLPCAKLLPFITMSQQHTASVELKLGISNSLRARSRCADLELALAGVEVLLRRADEGVDRINGRGQAATGATGAGGEGGVLGVCSFGLLDPQPTLDASPMTAIDGSHARIVIWALPRGPTLLKRRGRS